MRAVWYDELGPADEVLQIGELETPSAAAGEVRVAVKASGVNPSDVKIRNGLRQPMAYPRIIPNSDGAGVVDQIGEGVSEEMLGQRVWLYNGQRAGRAFGTAANFIALDADLVTPLPDGVSFEEGACLGIPCMTAHRCVFADGPVENLTVLVTGGAGAVGHYAVQLAKWGGARVISTVSTPEKAAIAKAGGADWVINYRREDVVDHIMSVTVGGGVDRIVDVDFGGNLAISEQVVKNNGSISVYASGGAEAPAMPVYPFMAKNVVLRFMVLNSCPQSARQQAQSDITNWLTEAPCSHQIAGQFALEDTASAHRLAESGSKSGTAIVTL